MTDYEALQREADGCHAWVLSRLADCCEESGDVFRAAGYRWLAEKGGWPRPATAGPPGFLWDRAGPLWPRQAGGEVLPYHLGGELFVGGEDGGRRTRRWPTVSAALDAAALHVGRWLLAPSATVAASAGGAP